MTQTRVFNLSAFIATAILIVAIILPVSRIDALTSSSLTLSDSRPSQAGVTYTFDTSSVTATTIECFDFVLNTQADGGGSAVGTTTSFTLGTSTYPANDTNWTENTAVNGRMRAVYATGETPGDGNLVFNNVTNGATPDTTYFGIFTSYSDDTCVTPVDTVTVAFIYKNGALVSLTIDPSLTFTVAGVANAQSVNGASTSITTTATAINYLNDVVSGTPGISAHDLTVGTNATSGYTVYIRHTGPLQNAALDNITPWTGTNTAPTGSFPTTAEAWGYTTQDSTLTAVGDGVDRFTNPGNEWAGFTTGNQEVVYSATPQASQLTRVGHQVAVSSATEAGTYQTTIVYTAASVY